MLSAQGKEDTHPYAQVSESSVLKSKGMISGHPFLTKAKPWIYLRICSLEQSFLDSWRDRELIWDLSRVWVLGFYKADLGNYDFESKGGCP